MNLPALAALLESWTIGREKGLLVNGDTLYWRLFVDGNPTVVPQTCAELVNPTVDGPIIVAAVNNLPALLRIAQAALAWRDKSVHTGDANCSAGDHDDCTEADYLKQLRAAIDSALSTGEAGK